MSPSRPTTGVATAAAMRYPVSVQVTPLSSVCKPRMRSGMAGTTVVCASAYASAETLKMRSVHVGLRRSAAERVMAPLALSCAPASAPGPSGQTLAKLVELVPERLGQAVAEALVVRSDALCLLAPCLV